MSRIRNLFLLLAVICCLGMSSQSAQAGDSVWTPISPPTSGMALPVNGPPPGAGVPFTKDIMTGGLWWGQPPQYLHVDPSNPYASNNDLPDGSLVPPPQISINVEFFEDQYGNVKAVVISSPPFTMQTYTVIVYQP